MPKKTLVILAVVVFLLTTAGSYLFFSNNGIPSDYKTLFAEDEEVEEGSLIAGGPRTEECPLNGQLYSKAQKKKWENRRPLGVAIENHLEARPQSGLAAADIIYEAVAEGGITRFLAVYYCEDSPIIGPVRSARIYFLKLLQGYGNFPLYAHVGGANTPGPADALGEIRDLGWDGYNGLNQFSVPFPIYYRDYDRLPGVATEHTMYSSTLKLWEFAKDKRKLTEKDEDGKWDDDFTPWKFKKDAKMENRGSTSPISFGFWDQFGNTYAVKWLYDKNSNAYKRQNGGADHIDKNTGKALVAKNIVIVFSDESPANDGYPGGHLLYDLTGTGNGLLFNDGKATKVTWRKNKAGDMMRFYTGGKEVELVGGKTYVEILPTGNDVTY